MSTIVLKFGGASVATPESFQNIAEIILKKNEEFSRVVVVVSAMGNTTDELIDLAKKVHAEPPRRELDMLISVGERISISLLAMALDVKGAKAKSFTGSQSGIITTPSHADARVIEVRPHRVEQALQQGCIAIVAGFQGVSSQGEITTLGRGGSDTSAVALAVALQAERVEFYKDVPGIFSADPKKDCQAQHLAEISYDQALGICRKGARILHARSVELAQKNALPLRVLSFLEKESQDTWIMERGAPRFSSPLYEDAAVACFKL